MTTTNKIELPSTYTQDAISRDLDIGTEVKCTKRLTTMEVTREQLKELRSDADYYSTEWRYMGKTFMGLGMSAKAALKRIDAALADWPEDPDPDPQGSDDNETTTGEDTMKRNDTTKREPSDWVKEMTDAERHQESKNFARKLSRNLKKAGHDRAVNPRATTFGIKADQPGFYVKANGLGATYVYAMVYLTDHSVMIDPLKETLEGMNYLVKDRSTSMGHQALEVSAPKYWAKEATAADEIEDLKKATKERLQAELEKTPTKAAPKVTQEELDADVCGDVPDDAWDHQEAAPEDLERPQADEDPQGDGIPAPQPTEADLDALRGMVDAAEADARTAWDTNNRNAEDLQKAEDKLALKEAVLTLNRKRVQGLMNANHRLEKRVEALQNELAELKATQAEEAK